MSRIEELTDEAAALDINDKKAAVAEDSDENEEGQVQGDFPKEVSRQEKKARKELSKLGLKKIEGINRVTLRRPKNVSLRLFSG